MHTLYYAQGREVTLWREVKVCGWKKKVWRVISVSDLALIGRVPISFPTPSTSTAIASQYLFAVLEHSFTYTRDTAQSFSISSKCF